MTERQNDKLFSGAGPPDEPPLRPVLAEIPAQNSDSDIAGISHSMHLKQHAAPQFFGFWTRPARVRPDSGLRTELQYVPWGLLMISCIEAFSVDSRRALLRDAVLLVLMGTVF